MRGKKPSPGHERSGQGPLPPVQNLPEEGLPDAQTLVIWSSALEKGEDTSGLFDLSHHQNLPEDLTVRRVRIDPSPRQRGDHPGEKGFHPCPGTDAALVAGIAYVWLCENLCSRHFTSARTRGFDEWQGYLLGAQDGIPKTPEWAASETRVPAREIKALARQWGTSRTSLAIGNPGDNCSDWNQRVEFLAAMQGMDRLGPHLWTSPQGTPENECCFPVTTETSAASEPRKPGTGAGSKEGRRSATCDVIGSVAFNFGLECAADAVITITCLATQAARSTRTNNYGDFKLTAFKRNSGPHSLEIEWEGVLRSFEIDMKENIDLGVVHF